MDEQGTKVIWDDDEDEQGNPLIQTGMQTMSSFFAPLPLLSSPSSSSSSSSSSSNGGKSAASRAHLPIATRNNYFQTRHMNIATTF
jgi:hypothetical protein